MFCPTMWSDIWTIIQMYLVIGIPFWIAMALTSY